MRQLGVVLCVGLTCRVALAQTPLSPAPQKPWGIAALPSADSAPSPVDQPSGIPGVPSCLQLVRLIAALTFDLRLVNTPLTEASLAKTLSTKECDSYRAASRTKWAAVNIDMTRLVAYCNEKVPVKARACFGQNGSGPLPKAQCDAAMGQAWDIMSTAHSMRLCRNLPVKNAIEAEACRRRNPEVTELFHRIDGAIKMIENKAPSDVTERACPGMIRSKPAGQSPGM